LKRELDSLEDLNSEIIENIGNVKAFKNATEQEKHQMMYKASIFSKLFRFLGVKNIRQRQEGI